MVPRRSFILVVAAALLPALAASVPSAVHACGDKFIVYGTSAPLGSGSHDLATGAIIIYRNLDRTSETAVTDPELPELLHRAGHDVYLASELDDIRTASETGDVDVILADLDDAPAVRETLADLDRPPVLLPVVYRADWSTIMSLRETYSCILNTPSRPTQFHAVIMDAIRSRS